MIELPGFVEKSYYLRPNSNEKNGNMSDIDNRWKDNYT